MNAKGREKELIRAFSRFFAGWKLYEKGFIY